MDRQIKKRFIHLWKKYFDGAELPVVFYYTNEPGDVKAMKPSHSPECIISELSKAREGKTICFNAESGICFGGKRYLGFAQEMRPNFEYFLSCGIPGKLEGERYKKSPELVKESMEKLPAFEAPAKFIVFKRWDKLGETEEPAVVIFFALPDVLSGLFTLANYDETEANGVFAPFAAGCGSIVRYPYLEKDSQRPRGVLGMFDVSARPWVPREVLTFSVPMIKFVRMIENVEESFLVTPSWKKVSKRINRGRKDKRL